MTLWQLKAFVTVAKEGSFTKAGKVLHITQPSVSSLITDLQKELGVKLFEKLGIRPHLTEAGAHLLRLAEGALAIIDKIPEEIEQVTGLKKGKLAVGGSGFAGATLLPIAVQAFKKSHPSIEVKLMIQPSVVLEEKLLSGELDFGLLGLMPKSRLLNVQRYGREEIVAVASPSHPLARRKTVPLRLLAQQAIVSDEKGGHVREMVEKIFTKKGLPFAPALEITATFGGKDAIKTAVAHGLGIAFIAKHHIDLDVKAGRLKILKTPDLKIKRVMYLVAHKARKNSLAELFARFLRTHGMR
jgi:DNA-binding transcriptional LysR family regulator